MAAAPTNPSPRITLASPQTFRNAFLFPVQTPAARRDVCWGGLWLLLIPPVGWLLNMGHRVVVTHRMLAGCQDPWPAWQRPTELLRHGLITFAGMVLYHLPATLVFASSWWWEVSWLWWVGVPLWLLGTCMVPGYMTAYCVAYDPREVFNIPRAMRRVLRAGRPYWKAWAIALTALACSLIGLLGVVLFCWTSVWFWQAAAFAFAKAMVERDPGPTGHV